MAALEATLFFIFSTTTCSSSYPQTLIIPLSASHLPLPPNSPFVPSIFFHLWRAFSFYNLAKWEGLAHFNVHCSSSLFKTTITPSRTSCNTFIAVVLPSKFAGNGTQNKEDLGVIQKTSIESDVSSRKMHEKVNVLSRKMHKKVVNICSDVYRSSSPFIFLLWFSPLLFECL